MFLGTNQTIELRNYEKILLCTHLHRDTCFDFKRTENSITRINNVHFVICLKLTLWFSVSQFNLVKRSRDLMGGIPLP